MTHPPAHRPGCGAEPRSQPMGPEALSAQERGPLKTGEALGGKALTAANLYPTDANGVPVASKPYEDLTLYEIDLLEHMGIVHVEAIEALGMLYPGSAFLLRGPS